MPEKRIETRIRKRKKQSEQTNMRRRDYASKRLSKRTNIKRKVYTSKQLIEEINMQRNMGCFLKRFSINEKKKCKKK